MATYGNFSKGGAVNLVKKICDLTGEWSGRNAFLNRKVNQKIVEEIMHGSLFCNCLFPQLQASIMWIPWNVFGIEIYVTLFII